jgi:hypothetical protein
MKPWCQGQASIEVPCLCPQFGWTCELEELEDEGRELLQESFDSNPVWSGQVMRLVRCPGRAR